MIIKQRFDYSEKQEHRLRREARVRGVEGGKSTGCSGKTECGLQREVRALVAAGKQSTSCSGKTRRGAIVTSCKMHSIETDERLPKRLENDAWKRCFQ